MELPHSRPLGNQGRKATHDFLSLYSSPVQQDPTPPQGGYLKTHDFLQPLELVEKNATRDENSVRITAAEKPLSQPPMPSVEHLLPGGIGTYTISYFNEKVLKPDGSSLFTAHASSTTRNDENSNSSSHTGSGFTLWDETVIIQGKTGKENISAERHTLQEAGMDAVGGGQWPSVLERQSQSSSTHKHNIATFSSFSSSQPSSSEKKQSFMDMITLGKNDQEEEDEDDDDEEFTAKKENSPHPKGNLPIKVEAKTVDQKPNTPRSKHSATEQRRRSKINDRFQKLREIIPNSDQKRDKASFLLEVIEYVQFLHEKVSKYETSYPVWNHEPAKIMRWKNCPMPEGYMDPARGIITGSGPPSVFTAKFDENKAAISPTIPKNGQSLVESDITPATTLKQMGQQPELASKMIPVHSPVQPNIFTFARPNVASKPASGTDRTTTSWPTSQLLQENRSFTDNCAGRGDKMKDQEMTVESGTINISSVYSKRLLNSLSQALQSSGVDLSQASISVQIDIGKTGNNSILNSSASTLKGDDITANLARSRVGSMAEEFDQAPKRLRTS